jgi:sialic acid synthase SpsE
MAQTIEIGGCTVGEDRPVFIIAEAGVNHNGDFQLAKKLVDVAYDAGVDAVKFQTFKTENVITRTAKMADYQKEQVHDADSQFEMAKKLELDYGDFVELKEYCDNKGILFLSTPHSPDAVDFLDALVPAYKIGSGRNCACRK